MAEARGYGLTPQLDIGQILLEAQQRWLRPAEICEILQNYQKFRISPEPPNKPPSVDLAAATPRDSHPTAVEGGASGGSLFLFDRKVLRYFRKDGLNWRKKKDGKTIREAHERLKAGSVEVLHCYYAHGEENENFQRRSYWMLEEDFMHIVLVHYLEVKSSRASCIHSKSSGEITRVSHMDSPVCSNSLTSQSQSQSQLPSRITDAGSPDSTQTSEYGDAESDNYQTRSRYHAFPELQQYEYGSLMDVPLSNHYAPVPSLSNQGNHQRLQATPPESDSYSVAQEDITRVFDETGLGLTVSGFKSHIDLALWDEVLEHCTTGFQSASYQPSVASTEAATMDNPKHETLTLEEIFYEDLGFKQEDSFIAQCKSMWQSQLSDAEVGSLVTSIDVESDLSTEGNINYRSLTKQQSLGLSNIEESLKKHDSFSRWMGKELVELDDSNVKISSGVYFSTAESQSIFEDSRLSNQEYLDAYLMSPSLSQEQLFNIIDFSPNFGYTNLETKVLITGTFLKNKEDVEKCKWSCMFGEVEVPAEVIADGTLRCHAPPHKSGSVPFYITCSNRVACSQVREFEYQDNHTQYMETSDCYGSSNTNEMNLHRRLENLLSLGSLGQQQSVSSSISRIPNSISKISSLMMEVDDGWFNMLKLTSENGLSPDSATDQFLEKLLKEKLHIWILHKVAEDSKAPRVLDKEGQGVIHLAAALGYDWAIKPTITAGVNINFRDAHGWTALHWAAFCGRERTVVSLIALGAAPGALTDPTPEFPSGRTPADLASWSGHKGIAGFLAESSLTSHLSALTLKDSRESELAELYSVETGIDDVTEKSVIHLADGDMQARLSLKDSLTAVQNAAQAAARIYQVFRLHSFHRKKLIEYGDNKRGISNEHALSLVSLKSTKPAQNDMHVHAAAIRIQNKFRGWKGRREFLIVQQRIVKIQAHVRGHQVRKHYKKIIWSVGIVEKAILRWRRKGSGLRGFQSDGLINGPTIQNRPKVDDYDILQEGRKQTEARLERALARVKSMVQYPEARDQYRRLLTVVTEIQKAKVMQERTLKESEETAEDDFMVEVEALLDDDMLLPAAW